MNNKNDKIVASFLMGECSEEELRMLNAWLNESEENRQQLFSAEELYYLGKSDVTWDEKRTQQAAKHLLKRLEQEKKKRERRLLMRRCMTWAAVFLGVVLLGGISLNIYQSSYRKQADVMMMVAATNQVKNLLLPDGTKVWLNRNTILKYPRDFVGKNRLVYLDGEGFFDVKKNPEKPFVVQSTAMQVEVLGTVFNFKTGKDGRKAVATLLKGEVKVKGNNGEGLIMLSPGQQAELDRATKSLFVKPADPGIEMWHSSAFELRQTDIFALCKILEEAYNVKIILAPEVDRTKTYSGPLKKKKTVGETLDLIKNSLGIQYKIVGNNVFISQAKHY